MHSITLNELVGNTDIYLLDQIMKGRYHEGDKLLDAGCGNGRNLPWFILNGILVYGIDSDVNRIGEVFSYYPMLSKSRFLSGSLDQLPFATDFFDHIICSAVLHFAESVADFKASVSELVRVLKPGGSLFIRMTSDIGIEEKVLIIKNGVYQIPDGSVRFLLTRPLLKDLMVDNGLTFLEPVKTVNVNDFRCMTTLTLQKNELEN